MKGNDLETMLGEPKHAIRSLALALSLSYLIVQLNSFIDSYWTTGLGDEAMSAVATMNPVYWIVTAVGIGLGVGVSTTIAFHLGRGDTERTGLLAGNALITGLIASAVVSTIVYFSLEPMVEFIGADDIKESCIDYAIPFANMSFALILNGIVTGLLRSEGSRTKSIIVLVISAGLNIVLDPILMFDMGMGVSGAGWATCIGAFISTLLGLYWYATGRMEVKLTRSSLRFDRRASLEVLGVGAPRTAEALVTGITNVIQRVFIVAVGATAGVLLYNLPWRYITIIIVISEALGAAMIPVCSAALGQNDREKAIMGMRYAAVLSTVLTTAAAAIVFIFAEPLTELFMNDPSMEQHKDDLVWVMRMFCLFIPFDGLRKIGSCMLQVIRKSRVSTRAMLVWAVVKLFLYWVGSLYSFEMLIYATVAAYVFGGVWMMLLVRHYVRQSIPAVPAAV
ncbi:MAG: hypothetical protein E7Z64_04830 [Thermoplasmata archaeon]|nr:hypothetical protein [Thermoplasmata archaeon]